MNNGKKKMDSRNRVICSINHNEPDRIPIDLNGHRSSGIAVQAYVKLRDFLGLPESKLYVYDIIQQLALVEDDVIAIVGADVLEVGHDFYKNKEYWQDWCLHDGTKCKIPAYLKIDKLNDDNIIYGDDGHIICIQKKNCLYFEQTYFPLADNNDMTFNDLPYYLNQIMWYRLGIPPAPAGFDKLGLQIREDSARLLRENTQKAVYGSFGGSIFEMGEFSFRIDNFLYEIAVNPLRIHNFLDRITEIHLENMGKYLASASKYIDIIGFGDDFGMQTGPQISPQMYREFFKDRHKTLWNYAKKISPHIKISLHSCGGIYPLIKDMIEVGLDILNPVQFNCSDMELAKLKREFGKDLVFWGGGCDTREILPYANAEKIKDHVKRNISIMAPGGGFVFQQVHNILADVPPENIMAMYEAVSEY